MIKKDEKELISEMEQLLEYKLIRDYPPHKIKRATHPKGLGLVKAKFLISPDLDEKYKKVFLTAKNIIVGFDSPMRGVIHNRIQ